MDLTNQVYRKFDERIYHTRAIHGLKWNEIIIEVERCHTRYWLSSTDSIPLGTTSNNYYMKLWYWLTLRIDVRIDEYQLLDEYIFYVYLGTKILFGPNHMIDNKLLSYYRENSHACDDHHLYSNKQSCS